ncbi:MAG: hypothetical protein QOG77_3905 [Solirubrobacteraceae bacterium]|nr:hypothetical protein [Solirubrobacteraceae bacterium]
MAEGRPGGVEGDVGTRAMTVRLRDIDGKVLFETVLAPGVTAAG